MDFLSNSPDSSSPDLHLDHPTLEECMTIWTSTAGSWKDSLTLTLYLKESQFLRTVPLARNGGMTMWILVDKHLAPNNRPILSSCETFRKRSLTSDAGGIVEENIVHGIASVFCAPVYRRRGYAARLMTELAVVLRSWQLEYGRCVGTILYSDIGRTYYTKLGWHPNATNAQLVFQHGTSQWPNLAQPVLEEGLVDLCRRDEHIVRDAMAMPTPGVSKRVTILPDIDHMLWHIRKEEFAAEFIYGAKPYVKGAIAGSPGKQVWAIWTHRYYSNPKRRTFDNVLYILRLVIEGDVTANKALFIIGELPQLGNYTEQAASLVAILQAAQAEAAKWELNEVHLWEPSPLVRCMLSNSGLKYTEAERSTESIASGMWYGHNGGPAAAPAWINNEHYAWL